MATLSQKSFSAGEITSSLYARTDISRYGIALRTLKNFFVMKHGGLQNRPGSKWSAEVADKSNVARLIDFISSDDVAYVVEIGQYPNGHAYKDEQGYIRVHRGGEVQKERPFTVSSISNASTAVLTTTTDHDYVVGDEIYLSNVPPNGMTRLNNRFFIVRAVSHAGPYTITIEEKNQDDVDTSDTVIYPANFTDAGGGNVITVERVYEIESPYNESELFEIKYAQSADVMTLCHPNHPPKNLSRHNNTYVTPKILTGIQCREFSVTGGHRVQNYITAPGHTFQKGDWVMLDSMPVTGNWHVMDTVRFNVTSVSGNDVYLDMEGTGNIVTTTSPASGSLIDAETLVTTSTDHGLSAGDRVYIDNIDNPGPDELNGGNYTVGSVRSSTQFTLKDLQSQQLTNWASGGYVLQSPWVLETVLFNSSKLRPANGLMVEQDDRTDGAQDEVYFEFMMTYIDRETGEESGPALARWERKIESIQNAVDPIITFSNASGSDPHHTNPAFAWPRRPPLEDSDDIIVYLRNIIGMPELNARYFKAKRLSDTQVQLEGIDTTNFGAYIGTSGPHDTGLIQAVSTVVLDYRVRRDVTLYYGKVPNAKSYRFYVREATTISKDASLDSFKGWSEWEYAGDKTPNEDTFWVSDESTALSPLSPPPVGGIIFGKEDNYPSVTGFYQQRQIFASTNKNPETIWMSKSGNYKDFSTSIPSEDSDSLEFILAGDQVSKVQNFVDLGNLIVLTQTGEWSLNPDGSAITPSNINAKQYSHSGSSNIKPVPVNGSALFLQSRARIVRDLAFDFNIDGYKGNDVSLFSSHLFKDYTIVDWAYQENPDSILWVARSDGALLSMTYVKEQEMIAWARHELNGGLVESVAVIPEGNDDSLYIVVKRIINGEVVRYIERLSQRNILDIEDSIFVDSSLTYDGRNTDTSHTMTLVGDKQTIISVTTNTLPSLITSIEVTGHGLSSGDSIALSSMTGGTWNTLDSSNYTVTVVDSDNFTISQDTSGLGSFTSGDIETFRYTDSLTLTSSDDFFFSSDTDVSDGVGNEIHMYSGNDSIRLTIQSYTSSTVVGVTPKKTVPTSLRNTAISTWDKAVNQVAGLHHLEGEIVSVVGDAHVEASDSNDKYKKYKVINGFLNRLDEDETPLGLGLERAFGVIHIGKSYISDIETLDIDTSSAETLMDKNKIVSEVTLYLEESSTFWAGPKPPSDDTVNPKEFLVEYKMRENENYDNPPRLKTENVSLIIQPEWNGNGRVFIRNLDPAPLTVLAICPMGLFPYKNKRGDFG